MRRKIAEAIPEICLCPFCEYVNGDWNGIIEHMIDRHTDEEAWEQHPDWRGKYEPRKKKEK